MSIKKGSSSPTIKVGGTEKKLYRGSTQIYTPASANALTWAPPSLDQDAITINVPATGGTPNARSRFPSSGSYSSSQDLLVVMPGELRVGTIHIHGGRNIVLIGGHMTANPDKHTDNAVGGLETIAIYIRGNAGIIHIEGLLIDSTAEGQSDGINVETTGAVQIQNCRMIVAGRSDEIHGECYHAYWPTALARFDRVTGISNLHGFTLTGRPADMRRCNARYESVPWLTDNGVQVLWFIGRTSGNDGRERNYCRVDGPISFEECYLEPHPSRVLGNSIIPTSSQTSPDGQENCPTTGTSDERFFPNTLDDSLNAVVTGSIKLGPPPGGDFCPEGVAGLNYVSPGYL